MNKILLITDDSLIIRTLEISLEKAGYQLLCANSKQKTLEIAITEKLELIILDVMLADIDGYEFCKELRNNIDTILTPIIVISVKGDSGDKIIALESGADDYITKPFDTEELLNKINSILK